MIRSHPSTPLERESADFKPDGRRDERACPQACEREATKQPDKSHACRRGEVFGWLLYIVSIRTDLELFSGMPPEKPALELPDNTVSGVSAITCI